MSCNAVATAWAKIDLDLPENLRGLIDQEGTVNLVKLFVSKKFGVDVSHYTANNSVWLGFPGRDRVNFRIMVDQFGTVNTAAESYLLSENVVGKIAEDLSNEIGEFIRKAAGIALQAKVSQAAKKVLRVTGEQTVKGAKVITFEF